LVLLVLLNLHPLSLARTSPINSIKDSPEYRQGAIKMSSTVKNTTGMTQHMIRGQRLVLVACRHFACFWVLPPQQNKNQIKVINQQCFVLATKFTHTNTAINSTNIASMCSIDKELS
jgi:hypothetical protein